MKRYIASIQLPGRTMDIDTKAQSVEHMREIVAVMLGRPAAEAAKIKAVEQTGEGNGE